MHAEQLMRRAVLEVDERLQFVGSEDHGQRSMRGTRKLNR